MRSTLLLSILAVALGGCGDHGLPSDDLSVGEDMSAELDMGIPDDAKRIVTFTMFAQDFAQALCAHYMACGQLDAAQLNACIENNLRHTGWDQDVEVMKGRLEINELQCLMAVQTSRCDNSDINAWATRCGQFLYSGHVATGGACIADVECESGYCQHGGSDAGIEQVTGCPGTCAAPKPAGAPCRIDTDCQSDAICDRGGTNQCVTLAPVNQPCTNFFVGTGSGPSCKTGLNCATFPSGGGAPTCVVPVMQMTVGQPCDPFQGATTPTPACAPGMYCKLQYSTTTTACTGTTPGECGFGYCDTTAHVCHSASGATCAMKLAAAAACDFNNDGPSAFINSQCADGTFCAKFGAQTSPTCQPFGGANADCGVSTDCKVGFYCDTTQKCTAWKADGQPCADTSQCASETQQTVCIADNADAGTATTCQVTKNVGAACNPGFEDSLCEPSDLPGSTACVPNGSGGGTCAPKCF